MNKVVLVNPRGTQQHIEVGCFEHNNQHLNKLYKIHVQNGVKYEAHKWGETLYRFNKVSEPFRLFEDVIQVVELKQVGHHFKTFVKDDGERNFRFEECSQSYFTYDECYNAMLQEATRSMASEIDITQDFDFNEENSYEMKTIFGHDYIRYSIGDKSVKFEMCGG